MPLDILEVSECSIVLVNLHYVQCRPTYHGDVLKHGTETGLFFTLFFILSLNVSYTINYILYLLQLLYCHFHRICVLLCNWECCYNL